MIGFAASSAQLLMILVVILVVGVVIISFFTSEQNGGLSVNLARVLFCDMLYFFFAPACAGLGV